ncbi:glycosyltransferase [Shewanella sp. DAU334]|uniref:Glycosyltransferase n=1 Tax=Shewanella youngdeokensis TaxID=2999068 RepID=A0ABZ0K199_9GAMM|nr:glycosyltransferase [Shewanella sp. DAU334]
MDWLKASVNSVIDQTLKASLFVIVIDGAIDCEMYNFLVETEASNPSVVLMVGSENRGLSQCMNAIVDWVTQYEPQYFFRMDADDICMLNRFSRQIQLLEKHSKVDVLGSALIEIDETGERVGCRRLPVRHEVLLKSFSRRCPINHPTVVIRFKVFKDGHRYLGSLLNTQDYFFWIKLAKSGYRFANIKEPLLKFRRIGGFYKRRGRGKSWNEFKARLYAMQELDQFTFFNFVYALAILGLRMMPSFIVKKAYMLDRLLLKRRSER